MHPSCTLGTWWLTTVMVVVLNLYRIQRAHCQVVLGRLSTAMYYLIAYQRQGAYYSMCSLLRTQQLFPSSCHGHML